MPEKLPMTLRGPAQFTDFERKKVEEIKQFQQRMLKDQELLICVSEDGEIELDRVVGEADKAELPKHILAELSQGKVIRLFHNHPSNLSLSHADWNLSTTFGGRAEPIAINTSGSIFVGATLDLQGMTALLQSKNLGDVLLLGDGAYLATPVPTHMDDDQRGQYVRYKGLAAHLVSHALNQELANRRLVQYEFTLSPNDATLFAFADSVKLIEVAESKMKSML
jgi:hypothetical protein